MATGSIRRVLVPVDFSDASAAALRVAAALAAAHDAELAVLHAEVLEAPPYFTHAQVDALERARRASRAAAESYLRAFARAATPRPIRAIVADGAPSDTILQFAAGDDLIVMGTHGRRGAARWWLGSVTEQVVRAAVVPVLVVRPGVEDAPAVFARVVWFDHARGNGRGRAWATALAAPFNGLAVAAPPADPFEVGRTLDATLLVVTAAHDPRSADVERVAALIRGCGRPVLFVPEPAGEPA